MKGFGLYFPEEIGSFIFNDNQIIVIIFKPLIVQTWKNENWRGMHIFKVAIYRSCDIFFIFWYISVPQTMNTNRQWIGLQNIMQWQHWHLVNGSCDLGCPAQEFLMSWISSPHCWTGYPNSTAWSESLTCLSQHNYLVPANLYVAMASHLLLCIAVAPGYFQTIRTVHFHTHSLHDSNIKNTCI